MRGVARFVQSQGYTGSFGLQWNHFAKTQLDSANGTAASYETFLRKTGFELPALRGCRVLDAGCGMGRFAEVVSAAGAEVHAVDLSEAVEAAQHNLRAQPNIHFYQADIMNLPFAEGSFDYIYSIGVLHHTPDTKAAFMRLVPLLRPGGQIAIWVYSTRLRRRIGSELLRPLTSRLSKRLLLRMARIASPLYRVHQLPVLGRVSRVMLPTSMHSDPEWRWLDTFDWYSPTYQWKHSYPEVENWFAEAGLTQLRRLPVAVSVSGLSPVLRPE